jgi:hypothetical protein
MVCVTLVNTVSERNDNNIFGCSTSDLHTLENSGRCFEQWVLVNRSPLLFGILHEKLSEISICL